MAKQLTKDEAFDMMANDTRGKRPAKAKPKKSRNSQPGRAAQMDAGGRFNQIMRSGRDTAPDLKD